MRCREFYDKWQKDENWCEHCKSAVSEIHSYLRTVEALEKKGIGRSFAFANFSEGAARPIFRESDPDVQDGAFEKVLELLELQQEREKLGKVPDKITAKEVAVIVQEAKIGRTLKEPKPKREEPPAERVPLWSVTAWLFDNIGKYVGDYGDIDKKGLIEDLAKEMRKRHLGQVK
jgi:hypothetical protein